MRYPEVGSTVEYEGKTWTVQAITVRGDVVIHLGEGRGPTATVPVECVNVWGES